MKYRFINEHRHEYKVATMCRVLKVARAGYYAWLHQPDSNRAIEDKRLLDLIRDSYVASGGVYGRHEYLPICVKLERGAANIVSSESCVTTRYKRFAATKAPRQSRGVRQFLRPIVSIVNSPLMHPTACG